MKEASDGGFPNVIVPANNPRNPTYINECINPAALNLSTVFIKRPSNRLDNLEPKVVFLFSALPRFQFFTLKENKYPDMKIEAALKT